MSGTFYSLQQLLFAEQRAGKDEQHAHCRQLQSTAAVSTISVLASVFVSPDGMVKVATCMEEPHLYAYAVGCLGRLAKDARSQQKFASSGALSVLFLKLAQTQPATLTAAPIQRPAAAAVADLIMDALCAAIALQPAGFQTILQLIHSLATPIS